MSVLFKNESGFYISHKKYIDNLYTDVDQQGYHLIPTLFHIKRPFKSSTANKPLHNEDIKDIRNSFLEFLQEVKSNGFLPDEEDAHDDKLALETADSIHKETGSNAVSNASGFNSGTAKRETVNGSAFLFPENSTFYSKDVHEMGTLLKDESYDLILLDPPWWNKYIRRKRKFGDGYAMMPNSELKTLPIKRLLHKDSLVAVWTTNSRQNLDDLIGEIFPAWDVEFLAEWYWMKVTTAGDPICDFSDPPRKQPFERIVFGARKDRSLAFPEGHKLIVSVPSALHSHKPPLGEVLAEFLPTRPRCLEVFARYLLADWTSYGNEVLRLQHESVYERGGGE